AGVAGATATEPAPGLVQLAVRYTGRAESDAALLERVVAALVGAGIGVREAAPARATLEDVFTELTVADPEGHA
ncbi:MAG TPA: hypothetical protein VHU80_07235, partial [Polyangiaceae bacterium]|nr:hypothetical protein [Polyangiaceae bacterium]